ncbi:MAG: hypothetical protein CME06_02195 [Gemmatimonadetes bacterium]|nr:hypothetical protein [Gemmatimonadota bacterium]
MIRLTEKHRREIERHGEEVFPNECCGFLVGDAASGLRSVREVWPATNGRGDSPKNRYIVPPLEVVRAELECRRRGLDVVGYYHSHPNAPARPSSFDREHAWADYSYVIVSVAKGKAESMASWVVSDPDGPFVEETMAESET